MTDRERQCAPVLEQFIVLLLLPYTVLPSILSPLRNVTMLSGSRLNLSCPVDGDPLPTVHWSKDGSPSIPHPKFTQKNFTMVIASVQISDEGIYRRTARSRAGKDSSRALFKVQGTY